MRSPRPARLRRPARGFQGAGLVRLLLVCAVAAFGVATALLVWRLGGADPPAPHAPLAASREVRGVAWDVGASLALAPVLQEARRNGARCLVLIGGASATRGAASLGFHGCLTRKAPGDGDDDAAAAAAFVSQPHAVTLVSASASSAGASAAAAALCASRGRLAALLEDTATVARHALGLRQARCGTAVPPPLVLVSDEFAARNLLASGLASAADVVAVGAPQFDAAARLPAAEREETRRDIRGRLGVAQDAAVVLVVGQLKGTGELAQLAAEAVRLGAVQAGMIVVTHHPRADASDHAACERLAAAYPGTFADEARVEALGVGSETLVLAADVVLSGHSTVNVFAIVYGLLGVAYAATETAREELAREKGLERPPEVDAGAAFYIANAEELAGVLQEAGKQRRGEQLGPDAATVVGAQDSLRGNNFDGFAAQRVWGRIVSGLADRQ